MRFRSRRGSYGSPADYAGTLPRLHRKFTYFDIWATNSHMFLPLVYHRGLHQKGRCVVVSVALIGGNSNDRHFYTL